MDLVLIPPLINLAYAWLALAAVVVSLLALGVWALLATTSERKVRRTVDDVMRHWPDDTGHRGRA